MQQTELKALSILFNTSPLQTVRIKWPYMKVFNSRSRRCWKGTGAKKYRYLPSFRNSIRFFSIYEQNLRSSDRDVLEVWTFQNTAILWKKKSCKRSTAFCTGQNLQQHGFRRSRIIYRSSKRGWDGNYQMDGTDRACSWEIRLALLLHWLRIAKICQCTRLAGSLRHRISFGLGETVDSVFDTSR